MHRKLSTPTGGIGSPKRLIPLPEDARLMADGIEVPFTKNYMIDRHGTIYAYIEALDAAVESEMLIASTAGNQAIFFFPYNAKRLSIISYEEATKNIESHFCILNTISVPHFK